MTREQRLQQIKSRLFREDKVTISELAQRFSITARTIRNDLKLLEKEHACVLCRGGAQRPKLSKKSLWDAKITGLSELRALCPMGQSLSIEHAPLQKDIGSVYVLGSFHMDICSRLDHLPSSMETVRSNETHFFIGGKGTNQATAAAKISDHVHLSVKVGKDVFGQQAKTHLAQASLASWSLWESNKEPTGFAMIWVSEQNSETMITINSCANQTVTDDDLTQDGERIAKSKVLLCQLEINLSAIEYTLVMAKKHKTLIVMNPSPFQAEVIPWLNKIDVLTPNQLEAEQLSGVAIKDKNSLQQAAEWLHQQGCKNVIIQRPNHQYLWFDGRCYQYLTATPSVTIDNSGESDAFNGALAAQLANGAKLQYAIEYASCFAALKTEYSGASYMPNHSIVLHRLQQSPPFWR